MSHLSRRAFLSIGALTFGCVLGLAGCGESQTQTQSGGSVTSGGGDGEIVVGQFASLTGSEATFGLSSSRGFDLAIEEINAAGGINGRKIRVITYDTRGNSQEAGNAVTRLITQDKVVAVVGEVASSLSLAAGAVAQEYNVPMITPASTNSLVTQGRNMVHRICFIDPFQAYAGAKFAWDNLKARKVAILFDQSQAYSTGLKDDFKKAWAQFGGELTTEQAYSGGDQDFSAQLTTIRDTQPDVIYVPGYYTEVGNIALQARRLGITAPLLGGDGWTSSELHKIAGQAIEGSYFSNHYSEEEDRPILQEFVKNYKAKHGETPDAMAALGYDAALVLADALKRAESLESKDLAAAIAATKGVEAVTGRISLDENRNAVKPAVILQVAPGGKFKFVTSIAPPDAPQ